MEEKILARVRALLAKAESTEFPDEAEALSDKASELIARYGIDQALLAAAGETHDKIEVRVIHFDNPYARDKAQLLHCVAEPLRCRSVRITGDKTRYSKVVGFTSDLERVELLYTSLLVQATRQLVAQHAGHGKSTTSYRKSWFAGFSGAVLERLTEIENRAAAESVGKGATETGTPGTTLVLADRKAQVKERLDSEIGKVTRRSRRLATGGYNHGHAAGQRADLGSSRIKGRKGVIGR